MKGLVLSPEFAVNDNGFASPLLAMTPSRQTRLRRTRFVQLGSRPESWKISPEFLNCNGEMPSSGKSM